MKNLALALTALGFVATATPAMAGDQAAIETCRQQIAAQTGASDIRFRSIRGASSKRVEFVVSTSAGKGRVQCVVRRGNVVALSGAGVPENYAKN